MSIKNKKYLTVKEFVDLAETSTEIIIYTEQDSYDGGGKKPRCECESPVKNLIWDKKSGKLEWSDKDGDPRFSDLKESDVMKDITDDGEFYTSCYVVTK